MKPTPIEEYHEDMGDVVWWCWRDGDWLGEAPYIGSPNDLGYTVECHTFKERPAARFMVGGWPDFCTHFTPLPERPEPPEQGAL